MRETWKILNHVIKKMCVIQTGKLWIDLSIMIIVLSQQEIVDDFNKYFVNIGPSLAEKIVNPTEECNMNKYIQI